MEFEDLLKKATELLIDKVEPFIIYLFGSGGKNELREDSDIDIAFISDNEVSSYKSFMIAQELADIFKRDVDLVNLRDSSTVFKVQVVGNGKKIYCNDEKRRMYFEMRVFKEYALLNEERAEILKNIKERGNIYGD
ncbi:type VII toxin-antitoxin system MntA family adenylyltransferase antitoxin [Clostridium oceanicum]|uniref:Type II toxin-antitoxin system antitoxin n=1 Tax=Clostridium oceanicum TaxID=1543 RepID=A0ABP3UNN1_9CLOT